MQRDEATMRRNAMQKLKQVLDSINVLNYVM